MLIPLLAVFLICLAIFFVLLLTVSPGKPEPLHGHDSKPPEGSICEKTFTEIGGVKQGMFIRGNNRENPVLLFVHGGPSFSEYFLVDKYPVGLEDFFTVCYWEQRGGGISFTPQVTMESLNLDQLASDAVEVTNYLRERFNKDRIYLMAHSGGTAFAIKAAAGSPELYHAYIGIAQITDQAESERRAYSYMLDEYSSAGDEKMVAELKKYPLTENDSLILPFFKSVLRDKSMHELGIGTMRKMKSIMKGVFYPVWLCRAYTVREKINIWYSKFSFVNKSGLKEQILSLDIPLEVPRLEIPVYLVSGRHDMTVNYDLSREYFKQIESPVKGFYTFEESAHSPMFEEPAAFLKIMINDVLNQKTTLADSL